MLERRQLEAERQRLAAEREKRELHDRKLKEKKDAEALAAITKKNKELAEEEKVREYEKIARAKNRGKIYEISVVFTAFFSVLLHVAA